MASADEVDAAPQPRLELFAGRAWCALHTRARHEKKVAACCERLGVPAYLPLRPSVTFSGNKLNRFEVPLFAGYVFCSLGPRDLGELKRTSSVAHRIEAPDEEALLQQLRDVRRVEAARVELETRPGFVAGEQVTVARGPLVGLTGVVLRYKNRTRLQIAVQTIGQALLVDVAAELLVRLPPDERSSTNDHDRSAPRGADPSASREPR